MPEPSASLDALYKTAQVTAPPIDSASIPKLESTPLLETSSPIQLLLPRYAVSALVADLDLAPTAEAEITRAVEQARLRMEKL